jgi:hypothetical protein
LGDVSGPTQFEEYAVRKRFFSPLIVVVSALSISVPSVPAAFAATTQTGPPAGAVLRVDPTPRAASLGSSIGKATDITTLAKKVPRKRRRA